MLITLSVTFVSLLVLMAEIAQADITLKLNAHTTHSDTSPRSRAIGRSRPRRQGTAADHGIEARQAGSQIASPIDHAPIILNSPGGIISTVDLQIANVTLPFLIDSGSSQFWVATPGCPDCVTAKKAVASIPLPDGCWSTTLSYVSGQVSGCIVEQDLSIGDYSLPAQKVVAARELRGDLAAEGFSMSGILGLGRGSGDLEFGLPIIQQLNNSNQISSPTVGFYLNRDWQNGGTGELTFGDVTKSSHIDVSKSVWLPSTDDRLGMYHVQMDGMMNGASQVVPGRTVIIDTGSTNLMVPAHFLPDIYRTLSPGPVKMTQDGSYLLPCIQETHGLSLSFRGQDWPINYQDLVGAEEPGKDGYCRGKITATEGSDKSLTWIGAVFLKNVYTAFDVSDGSVTFYGLK